MPLCRLCKKKFPYKIKIDGKTRNLGNRKYCLKCSPFGSGNTRKLEKGSLTKEEKKKRNTDKCRKWQRKARKQRKQKLLEMANSGPFPKCIICGYNRCTRALEFHHKNTKEKEEKSFGIASKGMLSSWDKLVEEIKKCIILCSNCHREVHEGMHEQLTKEWG